MLKPGDDMTNVLAGPAENGGFAARLSYANLSLLGIDPT